MAKIIRSYNSKITMKNKIHLQQSYIYFALFIVSFFGLFVVVELNNEKLWTNDFRVYFDATIDYFNGKNPYVKNYGLDTGFFKYPPFTLYLFKFFTFFGYGVSQLIHLFLLTISLIVSIVTLKEIAEKIVDFKFNNKHTWILYITFLTVAIHLVREFHMGNINLYLLCLLVLGLKNIQSNRPIYTAFFWSLMLILKPIMILSVIPLLFHKKWKIIFMMAVIGCVFFIFPVINTGWTGNILLWNNWLKAVTNHGEYIISENSLTYLTNYYFGLKSEWIPSLICLIILVGFLIWKITKTGKNDEDLIFTTGILTAFSPNFFVTDTEHFLLIVPLISFLLLMLSKIKSWLAWSGFFIGMLLFSFNSNDLLGREFSDNLDAHGILGIGNIWFILIFFFIYNRYQSVKNMQRNQNELSHF